MIGHDLPAKADGTNYTAQEALDYAGLAGWDLQKLPLYTRVGDKELIVPGRYAHTRMSDGQILGVVGSKYRTVSNEEAFDWANALVGGDGFHFINALSAFDGSKVMLQLEVPFEFTLPDGKKVVQRLCLGNSHDGSSNIYAVLWQMRIFCMNQFRMLSHKGGDRFSIRHTASAQQKLAEAQRVLHLTEGAAERAGQLAEKLYKQKISEKQVQAIIDAVYPLPETKGDKQGEKRAYTIAENKRDEVLALYRSEGESDIRGTAWGVYNAFTNQTTRKVEDASTSKQAETVFNNIMLGKTVADKVLELVTA